MCGIGRLATIGLTGAALVLAGCGGHGSAPTRARAAPSTTTSSAAAAAALPQPGVRCPGPDAPATPLYFPAGIGTRLDGALVGSGRIGAVLLSEYPGSYCGWWAYAVELARHGVHVLVFDFHCQGLSACGHDRLDYLADAVGAIAALRAHGARSIALIGASLGGSVALAAAASEHPAALVDLSGEADPGKIVHGLRLNGAHFAPRVHAPALFAVAGGDHYVSVNAMRAIYDATRSPTKTLHILPQSAGHGWDMLTSPTGRFTPLAGEIITFVTAHRATTPQQQAAPEQAN